MLLCTLQLSSTVTLSQLLCGGDCIQLSRDISRHHHAFNALQSRDLLPWGAHTRSEDLRFRITSLNTILALCTTETANTKAVSTAPTGLTTRAAATREDRA